MTTSAPLDETLTTVVRSVGCVDRLFHTGGLASTLLTSAIATAARTAPEGPGVSVGERGPTTVVTASIGATTGRPARETVAEVADALLLSLADEGVTDADVTVRLSRIH